MCISKVEQNKCKMINRNDLGQAIRVVLGKAKDEMRLISDFVPAICYMEKNPDDVLLCILPDTKPGDAASHMQIVLLEAYCYENYIPVIQVDSSEKLARLCGSPPNTYTSCSCAIITRNNTSFEIDKEMPLSPAEQTLTDFYQCTLDELPKPIVQLPPR